MNYFIESFQLSAMTKPKVLNVLKIEHFEVTANRNHLKMFASGV